MCTLFSSPPHFTLVFATEITNEINRDFVRIFDGPVSTSPIYQAIALMNQAQFDHCVSYELTVCPDGYEYTHNALAIIDETCTAYPPLQFPDGWVKPKLTYSTCRACGMQRYLPGIGCDICDFGVNDQPPIGMKDVPLYWHPEPDELSEEEDFDEPENSRFTDSENETCEWCGHIGLVNHDCYESHD